MYFNERGRATCLPPWGLASGSGFGMSCCQKTPDMQAARPAKEHHRAEVAQKEVKKSSLSSLIKSLGVDVHSGGQDWHPSAGMRYRLSKSEMGISRQWRGALYHVRGFGVFKSV